MAQLTREYIDEKFQKQTEAIIAVVNQRFDEHEQRLKRIEELNILTCELGG